MVVPPKIMFAEADSSLADDTGTLQTQLN